jgi:DNA-binding GntR family transcriptional regulator
MQNGLNPRQLLHEEVAARLRRFITEGQLVAGMKLNERVLAEQLQVSRTPLREAIKMLASERLVDLIPNRGAIVARLDRQTIVDLFELMASLEGLSGELAALRGDEAAFAEIKALHFEMLAAHARQDLSTYYRCNQAIHLAINRAAANTALSETYDAINLRLQALRFRSNFNREKWDHAVLEHQDMIEALTQKDGLRLRGLLEQHLRNKRDTVLAMLG